MDHGKDYFSDKPPFTTLDQIASARKKVAETERKYAVYYSERLHVEAAVFTGNLIADGAIGRVVQVIGMGPHRISLPQRPEWFFRKEKTGGILVDLGCHQIEQFLFYSGAKDARVISSKVANYKFKQYPELEDFGDATLVADNGATNYLRVDWLTPDGLGVWGDGRTFVLGTDGYIEMRKYIDVARSKDGDQVFLVDHQGERQFSVTGQVGFPFFGAPHPGLPEPHGEGLFPGDVFQGRGAGRHRGADRDTDRVISMGRVVRHEEIIHLISKLREVSVQTLTERFGVSEATIRKDLTLLEEMGYLVRTHGGAILAEDRKREESLASRQDKALKEKLAIVSRAREFIHEGDTIYVDSGSTCTLLAREVRDMTIRVICHSLGVYQELKSSPGASLFSLGGSYRKDAESFIGPIAMENLKHFQIETCFMGTASFNEKGIFSSQNIIEAQLKAEVLKNKQETDHPGGSYEIKCLRLLRLCPAGRIRCPHHRRRISGCRTVSGTWHRGPARGPKRDITDC